MSSTLEVIGTGSVVGAFLPPLTAIVQQPMWSARVKRIVALVVAALGGVVTVASAGGFSEFQNPVSAVGGIVAVLAAAQTTYDMVWKPSKIAPAVESATSSEQRQAG